MIAQKRLIRFSFAVLGLSLPLMVAGCKSKPAAPSDNDLTSQVQSKLTSDQNLSGQSIQAAVANGVVTLNGTVTDETARSVAASDAAQVNGVRTVVNNLTVQSPATQATVATPPPAPVEHERAPKPTPVIPREASRPAPVVRSQPSAPAPQVQQPAPAIARTPPPPPPPPAPVVRDVTLPSGSVLPVRITQTLDSASTQTGDKFTGVIASDIVKDGMVILPQGTPVTGHVDEAKDATHFKGSSLLTISLTSVSRKGERIDITTEPYSKEGQGRGKNTAEKVGGGAAVGAILGGIFGGGKGAAIGAAAGGGLGAGAQGVTRGQQVQIPSETVVRFRLANSVMVRVVGGSSSSSGQGLERRN